MFEQILKHVEVGVRRPNGRANAAVACRGRTFWPRAALLGVTMAAAALSSAPWAMADNSGTAGVTRSVASRMPADTLPPFVLAGKGCPMAHCDVRMTDAENMLPPLDAQPLILFQDPSPQGSGEGLGCASNGSTVACTYSNSDPSFPNLVVYDGDGNQKFNSGTLLDSKAAKSAPMVDTLGGLITADDHVVVRYDQYGNLLWQTPTPGGSPISPVLTANGAVVLATKGGPISIYSALDGSFHGELFPHDAGNGNFYDTDNTPCVIGNRVYVSMALRNDPANTARLYAFDIDPANTSAPISPAWYFILGGPSGASPLCANNSIYFDGDHLSPGNVGGPTIFAVADGGATGNLLWSRAVPGRIKANMPLDPRGGLWYFAAGQAQLVRCDLNTGRTLQTIDTSVPGTTAKMVPASAMGIAHNKQQQPMMVLSLQASPLSSGPSYVVSMNLTTSTLQWAVEVSTDATANRTGSQFAIVKGSNGLPRVAFSTFYHGVAFVGHP